MFKMICYLLSLNPMVISMSRFEGFKIVLTGDESLVGTYHHTYLGFSSGLPMDVSLAS